MMVPYSNCSSNLFIINMQFTKLSSTTRYVLYMKIIFESTLGSKAYKKQRLKISKLLDVTIIIIIPCHSVIWKYLDDEK